LISLGARGLHGIAKHLRAALPSAMRSLVNTSAFNALQHLDHIHRAELGDGTRADVREHEGFKGPYRLGEGGRRQFLFLQRQPFARDRFKSVRCSQLLGLPLAAGINARSEQPARFVATLARQFQ
jgi:hypothetical protein